MQAWPLQSSMFISHLSPRYPLSHLHLKKFKALGQFMDKKKIRRITKKNYPEFPNFLPESSMVQYFTNPIETWIYEASIDFIFTFVPVESGRTHTSVVLEVDALTGSTILTGYSLTSITLPHYFWIWGA